MVAMKVAIVGYGIEGEVNYLYWKAKGADLTICDQDPDKVLPEGVSRQLGPHYLQGLDQFDVIVRTAGLNPYKILAANPDVEAKITTAVDEFIRICPTKNIVGVTGTKGKGTTATLIASMLEASGRKAFLGGNIGVSPLAFLPDITPDDWVVLELSSFQLHDLKHSPHIAVCLMVVPDHLNWHEGMEAYTNAKVQLFAHQTPEDTAIYYADSELSHQIVSHSPGAKIPFFANPGAYVEDNHITIDTQQICHVDELKLLGKHNWQNACAAATVMWQIEQSILPIRQVLTTFSGLPHRLELVRELDGVQYYNDSFAATPDAAIGAMEAIRGKKVMIMGGFDRGLPLEHVAQAALDYASEIRKVVLIGAGGPRLATEFDKAGFTNYIEPEAHTMQEIVNAARAEAHTGDSVVLSPGFTSFDMFKNFEDRGLQFREVVSHLP